MKIAQGFADELRQATAELHVRAERSGVIADVLRGRCAATGYLMLLRNLHPVYCALEFGLREAPSEPGMREIAAPAVFRASAIRADLVRLLGPGWSLRHRLLPAGRDYARRVRSSRGRVPLMLAHAYVRYLGDLSGGRVLDRVMSKLPEIGVRGLDFHRFRGIDDLDAYRSSFRRAIDLAGEAIGRSGRAQACAEAIEAFRANIALSSEVGLGVAPAPAA